MRNKIFSFKEGVRYRCEGSDANTKFTITYIMWPSFVLVWCAWVRRVRSDEEWVLGVN